MNNNDTPGIIKLVAVSVQSEFPKKWVMGVIATGVRFNRLQIGKSGACMDFSLLGIFTSQQYTYNHAAITRGEARQWKVIAAGLNEGLTHFCRG